MSRDMPEPVSITADADERVLRIAWVDGERTACSFERLRWACPCATCRGEWGRPGVLDHTDRLTPAQTDLVDLRQVGRYAVCPIWADGHSSGIYTYRALRDLDAEPGTGSAE